MNNYFLILILVIILLFGNLIFISFALYMISRFLYKREDRLTREYYSSLDINDDKLNLLDRIIEIEFENYIKMHPDKFDITGNSYIKESEFESIITEITSMVYMRLTPAIIENINLTYSLKTQEDIINTIANKVGFNLALAASEINTSMLDESSSTTLSL